MYHDGTATNDVSRLDRAKQGIFQQSRAKSFPFFPGVNGQPGQQNERYGMCRLTFGHASRSLLPACGAGRQGVVCHYRILAGGNVCARGLASLVLERELLEVVV